MPALNAAAGRLDQMLQSAIRRAFDIAFAASGLLVAGPVIICVSILLRIDSPGGIFFSQPRLGVGGRHFRIYKFRKFSATADGSGRAVTLKDDPRMTRLGRLLERSKLDELPQLWNVLVGDMSIVGPRPESLAFADCFIGNFLGILDFKPGLFGPSQSIFRNESDLYPQDEDPHRFYRSQLFPTKARIDLGYYPSRTVISDLGWIIRSLSAVMGLVKFPDYRDGVLASHVAPCDTWQDAEATEQ